MTLNTQLMTIVVMTLMGLEFAAAYDTYMRIFRRAFSRKWILLICDINFMVGQAIVLFFLLYKVNHGEIRIYIVIALLCGYAIYQSIFRKLYIALIERFIRIFKAVYKLFRQITIIFLVKPVKLIIMVIVASIKLTVRLLDNFSKGVYYIVKRGVKVVILIIYKLFSPALVILKIIPIKYRIKSKVNFEKLMLKINLLKKK